MMRRSNVITAFTTVSLALAGASIAPVARAQTIAPASTSVESSGVVGDLRLERFSSAVFGNTRYLRVLLPPGYDAPANATKRYAVLYLADGQNLFDPATNVFGAAEWRVDEVVQQLVKDGRIPPIIVVGVDNAGATARAHEYLPWPDTINARRIPHYDAAPEGKKYPRLLIDEAIPFINARYRTMHDAAHTGIGGSSYGGLITLYTVLARPGVFGRALIESPTLQIYDGEVLKLLARSHQLPARVYLGIGTNEDSAPGCDPRATPRDDMFAAFQRAVTMFRTARLDSTRLRVVVAPCATHREAAWAERLPAALTFLFREP